MKNKTDLLCDKALTGIAKGDIDSLSLLYDHMGRKIYFLAYSLLKNHHDAEDILQQVLCEIIKSAQSYTPGSNAQAFILSVAKNQSLKLLRKKKTLLPVEEFSDDLLYLEDTSADLSFLTMYEALNGISAEERQIVLLHIESGLKFKEIAELLNITDASAQKKYRRALKKLENYYRSSEK